MTSLLPGPSVASPERVSRAILNTMYRTLPKVTLAIGVLYVGFAVLYTTRLQGALAALTGASAVALVAFARLTWHRTLSPARSQIAMGCVAALIIANITVEYVLSQAYLHGLGFALALICSGALLPTLRWLVAFMATSLLAWLAATVIVGIPVDADEATLALVASVLTGAMLFYVRVRTTGIVESLRLSVEQSHDRELRDLLDCSADAVLLHRDGEIVYANGALAKCLHYDDPRQLVGKHLESCTPPDRSQRLAAVLSDDPGDSSHALELLRSDGRSVVIEVSEPRTIQFEREPASMLVGRDITASQEALHAQLLFADRMAAVGVLAAGLAHELNTPLACVKLNLPLLDPRLATKTDDVHVTFEDTTTAIDRIVSIVGDLDSISHRDDHVEEIELTPVLEHAIELAHNEIRHRAEIVVELDAAPPILINRVKLLQALLNLLLHAARSVDDGRPDRRIAVRTYVDARQRSVVEISDNGPGLSSEAASHVFDPFFTATGDGFGGGLGLYSCHAVVTAAGGTIEVESELGRGTTFRVAFPPGVAAPRVIPAPPPVEHRGALQVLVIDDEPAVGRAIKRVLTGCEVTISTDGADAIARYGQLKPDLVLCDIMMPGLSGPAVFEELRASYPEVDARFVFMTGGAFTKRAREFVEQTTAPVLKKPIELATLQTLISDRQRCRETRYSPMTST